MTDDESRSSVREGPRAPIHVVHVGPINGPPNGMQTVIRTLHDNRLGADSAEMLPTWEIGKGLRKRLLPALATAAKLVSTDLRGTVVHIHVSRRGSFLRKGVVLVAARLRGATVVVTPHDGGLDVFARKHPRWVKIFFGLTHGVSALSEGQAVLLGDLCPDLEIAVVPNPVAIPDLKDVEPAGDVGPVVVFIGTVCLGKGIDVLDAAWPRVAASIPGARCVAAGPVTDYAVPEDSSLEFIGPVDHGQIEKLLKDARVVCLPSRAEVLPMTLLEAMASARPIVSTPVGAVPTLTQSGGLSVAVGDTESLAEALVLLLSDDARASELGERGRMFCAQQYGYEKVDALLSRLYEDSIAKRMSKGTDL